MLDKTEIERVKRANELVGFIRSHGVSLTQRGKQLVGLCPFHDDDEPSLVVDAKKQLWNCFHLPLNAGHKLVFCEKDHDSFCELQVEPFVFIQSADAQGTPCGACGHTQLALPDQMVVDQSSVPEHVDVFRARNFTTVVLATKAFRDLTNELGLTGIEFREVSVS